MRKSEAELCTFLAQHGRGRSHFFWLNLINVMIGAYDYSC